MKKLFLILICTAVLQGCVFVGYGAQYESGNYITVMAKDGDRKLDIIANIQGEDQGKLEEVVAHIKSIFKGWCE